MKTVKTVAVFHKMDLLEISLCRQLNKLAQWPLIRLLFQLASRLGDGIFWYLIMAALPLFAGYAGFLLSCQLAMTGLLCTAVYKLLKNRLVRQRPYISFQSIACCMPPLDRYSFPSGHTLHAVAFSIVLSAYVPFLKGLVIVFTLLVALSRPVLGLHYPTDVIMGAILGAWLAWLSLAYSPFPLHILG